MGLGEKKSVAKRDVIAFLIKNPQVDNIDDFVKVIFKNDRQMQPKTLKLYVLICWFVPGMEPQKPSENQTKTPPESTQKNAKKKEKHRTQIVIIKQIIHIHNVRKR